MKNLSTIVVVIVIVLLLGAGFMVWQNSQSQPAKPAAAPVSMIKKVDLSTQPQWVQMLKVTAKKGVSANSLANFTLTVDNMPKGMVSNFNYVVQYETSNKGTQGALSSKPIVVSGATVATKTIDLGTCSTKSCVRHDGVTSVEVELDFTTTSGDTPVWTGTISL